MSQELNPFAIAQQQLAMAVDVMGLDEATQIELIKELISAQLVSEATADTFTFRHALTRQAIYNELLQRERSGLHQSVGEAIEQLQIRAAAAKPGDSSASYSAGLANHFYEANQWAKALRYAQHAGTQAQRLDAPSAAVIHFTWAIEAAQKLDVEQPHHDLFHARAQAAERIGDFEHARADYETALAAARSTRATHAEWQNLLALGFLWTARSYQQAGDYFQAALGLARTRQEPIALGQTLNWLGRWHSMMDQPQEARQLQQEALTIFQTVGDRNGLAATLSLLGWTNDVGADLYASVAAYTEAVALTAFS